MTLLQKRTTVDIVAEATASGDPAQLAAANAAPKWREDRVIADGTLGCWDFKSPFCNNGAAISVATTFPNLVSGGAAMTVADATGMSQKLNGGGQLIGVRMTSRLGKLILPAACRPVAGQGRFGISLWATITARDVTKYSSLFGYASGTTTQAAIAIDLPTTSGGANITPNVDGGSATAHAYVLGTPFQIGVEYVPNGAASEKRVYWNGALIGTTVYDNGGSLNMPPAGTDIIIGETGSHDNTGMDWIIHRAMSEDFAVSGRTMADLSALSWGAYSGRFA